MSGSIACFVCGGTVFNARTREYRRCADCGHETLVATETQTYIVNDPLTERDARKVTGLDRFKSAVLRRFESGIEREQLVDVGSGSGKFLLQNGPRYTRAFGLEVTPQAVEFSREVLGLAIHHRMDEIPPGTTVATAWHAFEHIPTDVLLSLLDALRRGSAEGARLIVSVPNGNSRQYRWFGAAYAFFDVPNHAHQFTPTSLGMLLARFGFHPRRDVWSWPYNTFGYTQGLLNVITGTHNYLYYRLKRRSRRPSLLMDLIHVVLVPLLVPVGWILGAAEALGSPDHQGVITTCFEKRRA